MMQAEPIVGICSILFVTSRQRARWLKNSGGVATRRCATYSFRSCVYHVIFASKMALAKTCLSAGTQ